MKTIYRGHQIEVFRDRCLGGWSMLYWSIFRVSDMYECASGCMDTDDTVRTMIKVFKQRIDNELNDPKPWGDE